jgi:hypothetical protein
MAPAAPSSTVCEEPQLPLLLPSHRVPPFPALPSHCLLLYHFPLHLLPHLPSFLHSHCPRRPRAYPPPPDAPFVSLFANISFPFSPSTTLPSRCLYNRTSLPHFSHPLPPLSVPTPLPPFGVLFPPLRPAISALLLPSLSSHLRGNTLLLLSLPLSPHPACIVPKPANSLPISGCPAHRLVTRAAVSSPCASCTHSSLRCVSLVLLPLQLASGQCHRSEGLSNDSFIMFWLLVSLTLGLALSLSLLELSDNSFRGDRLASHSRNRCALVQALAHSKARSCSTAENRLQWELHTPACLWFCFWLCVLCGPANCTFVVLTALKTDVPDVGLPSDDDRGEQFVAEVSALPRNVVISLLRVPLPFRSPSRMVGHTKPAPPSFALTHVALKAMCGVSIHALEHLIPLVSL